jgi:hypothetical protein
MNEEKSEVTTLEEEGWTRRFVAGEPRLSEAVEAYKEAGFEVCLQPLSTEEPECETCPGEENSHRNGDQCRVCFEGVEDQYRIIYTRPSQGEKQ